MSTVNNVVVGSSNPDYETIKWESESYSVSLKKDVITENEFNLQITRKDDVYETYTKYEIHGMHGRILGVKSVFENGELQEYYVAPIGDVDLQKLSEISIDSDLGELYCYIEDIMKKTYPKKPTRH